MKKKASYFLFSIFLLISNSCGIKNNKQVEKDTLIYLKEKYNEEFEIAFISNNTKGHGRGSIGLATGNYFSLQAFPKSNESLIFFIDASYNSSGNFSVTNDTYISTIFSKQLCNSVKSKIQKQMSTAADSSLDLYLDIINPDIFKAVKPNEINYLSIITKNPYQCSINIKIDHFNAPNDTSEKKLTETIFPIIEALKEYKFLNCKVYFFFRDEKLRHNIIYKYATSKEPHYFDWINASLGSWQIDLSKDELEKVTPETLEQFIKQSQN